MNKELMEILACPVCKGELELKVETEEGDDVIEGALLCAKCNDPQPTRLPTQSPTYSPAANAGTRSCRAGLPGWASFVTGQSRYKFA